MNVSITIPKKLQLIKVSPISQPLLRLPIPKLLETKGKQINSTNRIEPIQTNDGKLGIMQTRNNVNNYYQNNLIRDMNGPNRSLSRNSNESRDSKRSASPKITFKFVSPNKNQSASKVNNNIVSDSNINLSEVNDGSANFEEFSSSFIKHLNPVRSQKKLLPVSPIKPMNQNEAISDSQYRNKITVSNALESVSQTPVQTFNRIEYENNQYLQKQNSNRSNFTARKQSNVERNETMVCPQGYMIKTANFNSKSEPKNLNCSINNTLDATNYSNHQNTLLALIKQLESKLQQSMCEANSLKNRSQTAESQNKTLKTLLKQKQFGLQNARSMQRTIQLQNKKLQNQVKMYRIQQKQMERQIQQLNEINSEKSDQLQKCRAFIKNLEQNISSLRK